MRIRLKNFVFYCIIVLENLLSVVIHSATVPTDEKSCDTRCSNYGKTDKSTPECGVWAQADNMKSMAGVYILNSGYANFTCTITSLPKPANVRWLFQADGDDQFRQLECDSMRIHNHCKFNSLGEHKVTSVCLLSIRDLEQSGIYKCTGSVPGKTAAHSSQAHLKIHGISNFTSMDNKVVYGKTANVDVQVCAYPKPDLTWIHDLSGTSITSGHSSGKYSATPLYQMLEPRGEYEPVRSHRYCYVGRLIIGKANSTDRYFTVTASNSVEMQQIKLKINLSGVPMLKKSAQMLIFDRRIYAVTLFIVLFSLFYNRM